MAEAKIMSQVVSLEPTLYGILCVYSDQLKKKSVSAFIREILIDHLIKNGILTQDKLMEIIK